MTHAANTTTPAPRAVALLGLGAMGQRMARRLAQAGHSLTVWNRSPGAAASLVEELVADGHAVQVAATPRAAAQGAQVVMSMVFDDHASREVWLGNVADPSSKRTGALAGLQPGALAVECSTLSPAWVGELSRTLSHNGHTFVDAPVAGSRPQAAAGQLIFMVGGEATDVDALRPVLLAMGQAVHHVGPTGSGAWLKLAVNALFGTQVAAVAEQLSLLRHAGLDMPKALDALKAMPVMSPTAAGAATLMLAGHYAPQAPVDLIAKDLGYALAAAQGPLPLTQAVRERFIAAQQAGLGAENLVAVAKLYQAAPVAAMAAPTLRLAA